jgi:hypothetical protein
MGVADVRQLAIAKVKQFPSLFWLLAQNRENDLLHLVRRNTDVVIEGPRRCGNHYSVYAFEDAQGGNVNIAHHFHAPSQLILAARWGLPAILLIRDPIDAATSNSVFFPGLSPEASIKTYNMFYEPLIPLLDSFVVADFPETTTRMSRVIERVNKKFNTHFLAFDDDEGTERVKRAVSERDGVTMRNGPVPDPEREELKKGARAAILSVQHSAVARQARRLFEICRAKSV